MGDRHLRDALLICLIAGNVLLFHFGFAVANLQANSGQRLALVKGLDRQ